MVPICLLVALPVFAVAFDFESGLNLKPMQYDNRWDPVRHSAGFIHVVAAGASLAGALCLDGSPPAYYHRPGYGSGSAKWLITIHSGGWCGSPEDCAKRAGMELGSSTSWYPYNIGEFQGMSSSDQNTNPVFYNWNVLFIGYCDGSSFTGDVHHPIIVDGKPIFLRGRRVLAHLLNHFQRSFPVLNATHALIAGCSAGGLSVLLHGERIRHLFPDTAIVKMVADAGLFYDMPAYSSTDQPHEHKFRQDMMDMCELHNCYDGLHPKCLASVSTSERWKCIFGMNILEHVNVPLLVTSSLLDTWQLLMAYKWPWYSVDTNGAQIITQQYASPLHTWLEKRLNEIADGNANIGFITTPCALHCLCRKPELWPLKHPFGYSMAELVSTWYIEDDWNVRVFGGHWQWPQHEACPPMSM